MRAIRAEGGWQAGPIVPRVCRSEGNAVSLSTATGVQRALAAVHTRLDGDLAGLHRGCIGFETGRRRVNRLPAMPA